LDALSGRCRDKFIEPAFFLLKSEVKQHVVGHISILALSAMPRLALVFRKFEQA